MGFLDFFSAEKRKIRRIEGAVRRANNKHLPKDHRQLALSDVMEAAKRGDEIAIAGLIARFGVNAEPSIEDEREKEWVSDALCEIGEAALPHIKRSLRTAESVNWVQRIFRKIVSDDEYKKELLDILADFDTEYERNPDRKTQTIMALAEIHESKVTEALIRFLEDVDETVRFQTVVALAKHADPMAREPLLKTMCEDESIRIRNEAVQAFADLAWETTGYKKKVDSILPQGYRQEKSGKIVKIGAS
jgi:HEAT repeat protein